MAKSKKKKRKAPVRDPNRPKLIAVEKGSADDYTLASGCANGLIVGQPNWKLPHGVNLTDVAKQYVIERHIAEAGQRQRDIKRLLTEYSAAMTSLGYGKTRDEIFGLDMVDISEAAALLREDEILTGFFGEWLESMDPFLPLVPCFENGCLYLGQDGYIHWQLRSVDVENKTMHVHLMFYTNEQDIWIPMVSGQYKIFIDDEDTDQEAMITIMPEPPDDKSLVFDDYHMLYKAIPMAKLGWTEPEKILWTDMVLEYARKNKIFMHEFKLTNGVCMARLFITMMNILSYHLAMYDASRPKSGPTEARERKIIAIRADKPADQPERKLRTIGAISVFSAKRPQPVTRESLIQYKTAVWTARGHIRHLKSGKAVYIHPQVKRRRCLTDEAPDLQPPRQTIMITNNLPPEPTVDS